MTDLNNFIIELRGEKVILDFNLAKLYGVKPFVLRQSVKRNITRFPDEFMFRLTAQEIREMVSQIVIPSHKILGGSTLMAFTELGVAMLSSVLKSKRAVEVNIMIIKIFVQLRKSIRTNNEVDLKFKAIENELSNHSEQLKILFNQLENLVDDKSSRKIGFNVD